LHGSKELYASGYDGEALATWATGVADWAKGKEAPTGNRAGPAARSERTSRDVFVYFDNDAKVRAPVDAEGLIARVTRLLK
jgi:uncharacterized protein YecE (DUF72 family)